MKTVLLWLAGGMLVAGVVLGFLPISSGEYQCGSAFHAGGDVQTKDFTSAIGGTDYGTQDCGGARSEGRRLPVLLLILGAATVGAALASSPARRSAPAARESARE